jgi:hypothetical protein
LPATYHLGTKLKDPRDSRVFTFDWTRELGADTIGTYALDVAAGLNIEAEGIVLPASQKVSVELSGGIAGDEYVVRCTITRATSGEVLSKSGVVVVRDL